MFFIRPPLLLWHPLEICPGQAQVLQVDVRSLVWPFPLITMFGAHVSRILLYSASFIISPLTESLSGN